MLHAAPKKTAANIASARISPTRCRIRQYLQLARATTAARPVKDMAPGASRVVLAGVAPPRGTLPWQGRRVHQGALRRRPHSLAPVAEPHRYVSDRHARRGKREYPCNP